jgi:hypothetical protein
MRSRSGCGFGDDFDLDGSDGEGFFLGIVNCPLWGPDYRVQARITMAAGFRRQPESLASLLA